MDKDVVKALIIAAIGLTVMGLVMYDIAKDNKKRGIKPKRIIPLIVEVKYLGVVGTEVKRGGFMGAMIGSFWGGDLGMVVGGLAPRGVRTRCRFEVKYENGKVKIEDCYEGDGRYNELMCHVKRAASERSEKKALNTAKELFDVGALSRSGLKECLKEESFTEEQVTHAVKNCGVDWNEQAVKAAKEYLELGPISRKGLVDALIEDDGFTPEQAEYAVKAIERNKD